MKLYIVYLIRDKIFNKLELVTILPELDKINIRKFRIIFIKKKNRRIEKKVIYVLKNLCIIYLVKKEILNFIIKITFLYHYFKFIANSIIFLKLYINLFRIRKNRII